MSNYYAEWHGVFIHDYTMLYISQTSCLYITDIHIYRERYTYDIMYIQDMCTIYIYTLFVDVQSYIIHMYNVCIHIYIHSFVDVETFDIYIYITVV